VVVVKGDRFLTIGALGTRKAWVDPQRRPQVKSSRMMIVTRGD